MAQPLLPARPRVGRRAFLVAAVALAGLAPPGRHARAAFNDSQRYICAEVGCLPYIYDPAEGDPEHGIPPGTPFADLPANWLCPICGAGPHRFVPYG